MLKAYSYLRFSHKSQATGDSVRRQTDLASDWCGRNGAVVDDALTYRDLGVSAFRGKNAKEGALSLFLGAVERGRVPTGSFLIIENLDRLTRAEFFTAIEIVGKILRAGIRLVTLFPEQVLTADDADEYKIMFVVMSLMRGHQESALKAKRLRELWAERRKQKSKLGNLCPSWLIYDKEGENRSPVV
jgi:DNA invertase Pin-like site-specific DNA recombinase